MVVGLVPEAGANPTTFEFTAPALQQARALFKVEENPFVFKMRQAIQGVGKIYNAGVVARDRRIENISSIL